MKRKKQQRKTNKETKKPSTIEKVMKILLSGGIFAALIATFIKPYFETWHNHNKELIIESNAIYNLNYGRDRLYSNPIKSDMFSNFVHNQVTVHQKSKASQAITKIELFDITKTDYASPDIQYDGGFYEESQQLVLLAYNNGNAQGDSQKLSVRFTVIGEQQKAIHTYDDYLVEPESLASGEVKSLWLYSFEQMIADFKANAQYWGMTIEVASDGQSAPMRISLQFNRQTDRFQILGTGGAVGYLENIPLLDLRQDISIQSVDTHIELKEGNNRVDFTVLVDRTCQLSYRLALWSGDKRIKSKEAYHITIRVPIYNQEQGYLFGDFYKLFEKYPQLLRQPFNYTADEISRLDKSLLYDKYKVAKEIYQFKD